MALKTSIARPSPDEYAPYYEKYVSLVPEREIVATLTQQLESTMSFLQEIDEEKSESRYEPTKWSIKEVLGHLIDGERIFAHRALRFARNDSTPLPGFEQNDYVREASFDRRRWPELLDEFGTVRRATIQLFKSLDEQAWTRRGVANDLEVSVKALAYIVAGHETHHLNILKDRYL